MHRQPVVLRLPCCLTLPHARTITVILTYLLRLLNTAVAPPWISLLAGSVIADLKLPVPVISYSVRYDLETPLNSSRAERPKTANPHAISFVVTFFVRSSRRLSRNYRLMRLMQGTPFSIDVVAGVTSSTGQLSR